MNSLNSVHLDNIQMTGQQDTSICKNIQANNDCDSSSVILLKKLDAPSPDYPGFKQHIFKPLQTLIIHFHVATFVRKLSRYIKPDLSFNSKHFSLINDKSAGNIKDFISYAGKSKSPIMQYPQLDEVSFFVRMRYNYRQLLTAIRNKSQQLFEQIPLIDSSYKIKIVWDILLNIFRIYFVYIIPIMITFDELINQYDDQIMLGQACFGIDLLLRFITIYYDQGLPVIDRYQIIRNQYHFSNIIELLQICVLFVMAYFPYSFNQQFVLFDGWPKLFMLLYFIQLKNLLNFIKSWQQSVLLGQSISSLIELSKLIGLLLLIQHIFSCIWLVIGKYQLYIGNTSNWITSNLLDDCTWVQLYIEAMYFTSVTMYTVGYGDIHPVNQSEKIFAFLFVFVCTFQLSFSLNTIGEMLTRMKNSNEIINKKLIFINQYMHNKKISHQLQFQVREYLNYYWYQEQTQQTKEQTDILGQLSDELRKSIALESNSLVLKNCEFFTKNFSSEFKNDLLKHLHFQSYQPSSTINIYNDEDYFIHIIESGQVDVYDRTKEKKVLIGSFRCGECFGVNEFLYSHKNSSFEYKSSGFVSTLVVPQSKFLQILSQYQNDYEHYWNLKIANYIDVKCPVCQSNRHEADKCKQVHFVPDREKVIKEYCFVQNQERRKFRRNKIRVRQLYHAATDQEVLREAAEMVRIKNESNVFLKYNQLDEDTTQFESKEQIRKDIDSVGVLIKDLESKSYLDYYPKFQGKSEKEIIDIRINLQEEIYNLQTLKEKLHHRELYTQKDIDQIDYVVKLLELKLKLDDQIQLDQYQEYQNFSQKSNLSMILKKLGHPIRFMVHSTSKSSDQVHLIAASVWLKYLFYPFEFINQYRHAHHRSPATRKSIVVRQQEHRLSSALLKKKKNSNLNRSPKRSSIQVFPIK